MLAYCRHDDKDEYVLELLRSEIRYRKICPLGIRYEIAYCCRAVKGTN